MCMECYTKSFPKARKNHTCEYCGQIINAGEQYSIEQGKWEGEFFTRKLHLHCEKILYECLADSGDYEFSWDQVDQWLHDSYCYDCDKKEECETKICEKIKKAFSEKEDKA